MSELLEDLEDEHAALDRMVASLEANAWEVVTPSEPWTVHDQISHLAFFDEQAALSATDPDRFVEQLNRELTDGIESFLDRHLARGRAMAPEELLRWWRSVRREMVSAFRMRQADERLPWYGPQMKARSAAAARLMETWAHGRDVADALGAVQVPTERLGHIGELGVKTFSWSFLNRGLVVPPERVRVELIGPTGRRWRWNETSEQAVTGPLEDFCLVVCQRRHVDDTALVIEGPTARHWMEIAQVFAGPPGPGRSATPSSP